METPDVTTVQSLVAGYTFLTSPPVVVGAVWWLVKKYFGKQEKLLTEVSTAMDDVKLKIALHENRAQRLDDALRDHSRMKEDITILRSKVDAAFRIIDHLTTFEKDVQNRLKPLPNGRDQDSGL